MNLMIIKWLLVYVHNFLIIILILIKENLSQLAYQTYGIPFDSTDHVDQAHGMRFPNFFAILK